MEVTVRRAAPHDKPRILAIAAQTWEGDDYVLDVIDEWLAPGPAELLAACEGEELIGFARYDRPLPSYAWFEGLRTDPARRNRGAAKALMRCMLDRARSDGASRAGLSTYLDNYASQHIIEKHGFERAAAFVYFEADIDSPARAQACRSAEVTPVAVAEARAFIEAAPFLAAGRGFFPHSWRFYPFAAGPEHVLGHMAHLLGVRRDARLVALLCAGRPLHGPGVFSIDYLDGEPGAVATLARHALAFAGGASFVEAMVPRWDDRAVPALGVLQDLGFKFWNELREDVLVYERVL